MSDYISRQAAIDGKIIIQLSNGVEIYSDEAVPVDYLKHLPSAELPIKEKCCVCPHCDNCDVNEDGTIERKKSEWNDIGGIIRWGCPFCHHAYDTKSNYCPYCGARMEVNDGKIC